MTPDQNASSKTREWLFRTQDGFSHFPPFPSYFCCYCVLGFFVFICCVFVFETESHNISSWLARNSVDNQAELELPAILLHRLPKSRDTVTSLHSGQALGVWALRMLTSTGSRCFPVPRTAKLEDTFLREKSNSEFILFFQFKFKITMCWLNFLDFYTLSFCSYMECNIFIHIHTDVNLDFILVFNRVIISFQTRMLIVLLTVTTGCSSKFLHNSFVPWDM